MSIDYTIDEAAELEDVADAILADLTDRRGFRQAWDDCDKEIQQEIRAAIKQAAPSASHAPRTREAMAREDELVAAYEKSLANADEQKEEEIAHLMARVKELEAAFRHYHVRGSDEHPDKCDQCGLDLRDEIHIRAGSGEAA